jgi:hypothetical protein
MEPEVCESFAFTMFLVVLSRLLQVIYSFRHNQWISFCFSYVAFHSTNSIMYNVLLYLVCLLLIEHMLVELKSSVFVHGSLGVTKFKLSKLVENNLLEMFPIGLLTAREKLRGNDNLHLCLRI